ILTTAPGGDEGGAAGLVLDGRGGLYATDGWMTVRRLDLTTGVSTVVAEIRGLPQPGDGDDIIQPSGPQGMALGSDGALFVALWFDRRVVRIDPETADVTPVAGTGVIDHTGDGGPAVEATLVLPSGLAIDGRGNLYISDNLSIRRVARVAPPG
ncbi:MAG: hypothetical protein PV358_18045, partial [Acidimicrobiales bacterium]|nr:hypothetical protein [Acidimicrobiales bacterium]